MYFNGMQERMASPEVSSNPTEFQKVARAAADLEQTVTAYREYEQLQQELAEAKELAAESAGCKISRQVVFHMLLYKHSPELSGCICTYVTLSGFCQHVTSSQVH